MSAVDGTVRQHWGRPTQEPQLTAKIAENLERLRGLTIAGESISVTIIAQDLPDRGPGSLESRTGADLYIGLKIKTPNSEIKKGLLIQAKWNEAMPPREMARLKDQCSELLDRSSNGAFVWAYGPSGTKVIPAREYFRGPTYQPSDLSSSNIEELFMNVMECISGDPNLAPQALFDNTDGLESFLEEVAAKSGVLIEAAPADEMTRRPG
jgi:hypothetical protein